MTDLNAPKMGATHKEASRTYVRLVNANHPCTAPWMFKLRDCLDYDDYDCGLAACRLCRATVSHRFSELMLSFYRRHTSVQSLTIIPSSGYCKFEDIDGFDMRKFLRNECTKLSRIFPDGTILFGVVDVCPCVLENKVTGEVRKWWQFHFHILIAEYPDRDTDRKLRARYPKNEAHGILRPVRFETIPISDLRSTSGYTYKEFFTTRSSYTENPDWSHPSKPRSQTMVAELDGMLQHALAKYSVFDLMFQLGVRRSTSSSIDGFKFHQMRKGTRRR